MKISSEKLERNRRRLTAEISVDEVKKFFDQAASELAKLTKIPGFRPGKAPSEVVRQQLDEGKLREEAYSLAVREAWQTIVKDLKELPIQDPEVEIKAFEEGKPASFAFEFDIRPEIKLGAWQKIRLKQGSETNVTDKEVEDVIKSLARAHAKQIIKLTPAKKGDKVHVAFEGSVNGVKQEKLSGKNFPILIGESNTIPGFDDQLVGLKKGEKKKFSLDFPKDHFDKSLAGQKAEFDIEIEEVFEVILAELNKEFAEKFGHKTAEQLKKAIHEDLIRQKSEEAFVSQKAKWLAEFEKLVKTDVPQSLIEAEALRSKQAWMEFLQSRNLQQESWLKDRNLSMEQLEADWRKAAETSVKIGLGLAEIAKESKKTLGSNEEFQALLDQLVKDALN